MSVMTWPYLCVTEMVQRSMTCPHGWLRGHGHECDDLAISLCNRDGSEVDDLSTWVAQRSWSCLLTLSPTCIYITLDLLVYSGVVQ